MLNIYLSDHNANSSFILWKVLCCVVVVFAQSMLKVCRLQDRFQNTNMALYSNVKVRVTQL